MFEYDHDSPNRPVREEMASITASGGRNERKANLFEAEKAKTIDDAAKLESFSQRAPYSSLLTEAIRASRQANYHEALALLEILETILQKTRSSSEDEQVEVYLAQAICHARLDNYHRQAMQVALRKARALELDEGRLKEKALQWGLLNS